MDIPERTKEEWTVLVEHVDMLGKGLNAWQIKFIADLIDRTPDVYSPKQQAIIERLYQEKCL